MNSAPRPIPPSEEPLAPRSLGTLAAALVTCTHPRGSRVRAALDLGPGETGIFWCAACGALGPQDPVAPWQAPSLTSAFSRKAFEDLVLLLHAVVQLAQLAQSHASSGAAGSPAHIFLRNAEPLALGARALARRARRRPAREGPREDPDAARLTPFPSARSRRCTRTMHLTLSSVKSFTPPRRLPKGSGLSCSRRSSVARSNVQGNSSAGAAPSSANSGSARRALARSKAGARHRRRELQIELLAVEARCWALEEVCRALVLTIEQAACSEVEEPPLAAGVTP